MVKRRPDEPAEGGKLCLPGGYVERHQTLASAAETEVLQETGYEIVPDTLRRFALMDGPPTLPGRTNEYNGNIVMVCTAQAGELVAEPDDEVTDVFWFDKQTLPPPEEMAFGHRDIVGIWFRHQVEPFGEMIVPSEMDRQDLFLPGWPDISDL